MPTRNVSLTDELDSYIETKVQSGQYDSASEVIRDAIRELQQSEAEDKAKVEYLRTSIEEGFGSGVYEGDPWARVDELIRSRRAPSINVMDALRQSREKQEAAAGKKSTKERQSA
jgi:antitoxin ParD1/3/4